LKLGKKKRRNWKSSTRWEDFNVIRYLMIVNYMNDHVVVEMYNDMFLNRGVMNIRVVALLKCVTIVSKWLDG